jgi:hypothetical protein
MDGIELSDDAGMPTNNTPLLTEHHDTFKALRPALRSHIHSRIMGSPLDTQQHALPTDLQTDAVRLYIAFQSQLNPEFLGAATELLSCVATLSPTEFRRHSRKVRFLYFGSTVYFGSYAALGRSSV